MGLANTAELIVCFFAVASLGATAAPLNPGYVKDEFMFYLDDMGPASLLVVPGMGNVEAEGAAEALGTAVVAIKTDKNGVVTISQKVRCNNPIIRDGSRPMDKASPSDVCLFLHTSGTTAKPKGVPLTHANMLCTMRNITEWYSLGPGDRGYVVMPLFHVHGLMCALFAALWSGGSIVLPAMGAGFQVAPFWRHISHYACNWYTAVPSMHQLLLADRGAFERAGKPKLRFIRSCSASLPPVVLHQLEATFGAPVLEAYAMTEACHQMASNPLPQHGPHKPGSVGLGTHVEITIIMTDGSESALPRGQVGEVCVKGANVMQGYRNRPEANAESFLKDGRGFFRTGDLGYLDEDGYLFLVGRIKEQINRGGEKLAPLAIDNALIACPAVQTLCAFAVPHAELGEVVGCAVVLRPGATLTLGELNRFGILAKTMQTQWLPQVLVLCDQIPKGPTGKIQRTKLASLFGLPILTEGSATYRWDHLEGLHHLESARPDAFCPGELGNGDDGNNNNNNPSHSALLLARMIEQVIAIALAESMDAEFQLDSFSAVRLARELKRQWGKIVRPEELVVSTTVNALFAKIMADAATTTTTTTTTAAPSDEVTDWEQEVAQYPLPPFHFSSSSSVVKRPSSSETRRSSVLLTGATGFLGSHILESLLSSPVVDRVFCLVRGSNLDAARLRLVQQLKEQRIEQHMVPFERVVLLLGDVSRHYFGFDDAVLEQLCAANVTSLIHNAAHVNHALSYASLKEQNVGSLIHAMVLAERLGGASLSFVSTAGVCGRKAFPTAESPQRLSPAELHSGATGYVKSKWVGERLMERVAANSPSPLQYAIFRPGAVTGHSRSGACNIGDSINRYVIGWCMLGWAPPLTPTAQVDMSPVDWVAGSIARIIPPDAESQRVSVYTLDNPNSLSFEALLGALNSLLAQPIQVASTYGEWFTLLTRALDNDHDDESKNPLRDLRGALALSPPRFGTSACPAHTALLTSLGHPPPVVDSKLLRTYIQFYIDQHSLNASILSE